MAFLDANSPVSARIIRIANSWSGQVLQCYSCIFLQFLGKELPWLLGFGVMPLYTPGADTSESNQKVNRIA